MECLLGITGKDCVVLAADSTAAHSIAVMKHGNGECFEDCSVIYLLYRTAGRIFYFCLITDQDKLVKFGSDMAAVLCGEHGDTAFFGEYIQKNITLYRMRHRKCAGTNLFLKLA